MFCSCDELWFGLYSLEMSVATGRILKHQFAVVN